MESRFRVNRQPPSSSFHRQSSLEDVLSFTLYSPEPSSDELAEAQLLYHEIIRACEKDQVFINPPGSTQTVLPPDHKDDDIPDQVHIHKLFECLWEYCPTDLGRHNVVRIVLLALFAPPQQLSETNDFAARSLAMVLPLAREYLSVSSGVAQREPVNNTLKLLAEELLASLFLPLKAQGRCTPAVTSLITPTSRSEVGPSQAITDRLRNLRFLVLARDGNSCVVSGIKDKNELRRGRRLRGHYAGPPGMKTEAAHIIPHSLNAVDGTGMLPESKHTVWRVLNMFDPGIAQSLEGPLIDSPGNAVLLLSELHDRFGALEAYFEEIEGESNAYRFVIANTYADLPDWLPVKQHIVMTNNEPLQSQWSPLPASRLLRLHRACALILNMSGAAGYVERLLDDSEELLQRGVLAQDGSSEIGIFLRMRGLCGVGNETWRQCSPVKGQGAR